MGEMFGTKNMCKALETKNMEHLTDGKKFSMTEFWYARWLWGREMEREEMGKVGRYRSRRTLEVSSRSLITRPFSSSEFFQ